MSHEIHTIADNFQFSEAIRKLISAMRSSNECAESAGGARSLIQGGVTSRANIRLLVEAHSESAIALLGMHGA